MRQRCTTAHEKVLYFEQAKATLEQGYAIRDAINSGERDYQDVLQLLQASRKFRHWLHQKEFSKFDLYEREQAWQK